MLAIFKFFCTISTKGTLFTLNIEGGIIKIYFIRKSFNLSTNLKDPEEIRHGKFKE